MPGVMHNYHTHNFESTQTKKFLEEEKLAPKTQSNSFDQTGKFDKTKLAEVYFSTQE